MNIRAWTEKFRERGRLEHKRCGLFGGSGFLVGHVGRQIADLLFLQKLQDDPGQRFVSAQRPGAFHAFRAFSAFEALQDFANRLSGKQSSE